jgi:hypothetical protein
MKTPFLLIFILCAFISCNNSGKTSQRNANNFEQRDTTEQEIATNRDSTMKEEFKSFKIYKLTDSISADFTGDGVPDRAFVTTIDSARRIALIDGKSGTLTVVGADKSFYGIGNDFSWADFWGTTNDEETLEAYETKDGDVDIKKTRLEHTSIFVRKDDVGGGMITFKNNKFVWLHQME